MNWVLVVVEFALDAIDSELEDIDGRPEQVPEVRQEAGVVKGGDEGVEDVGDGAATALPSGSGLGSGSSRKGR